MTQNKAILKKSKGKYMAQIPQAEITKALKELSQGAFRLLTYYYSRNDGWRFDDEIIAKTLDTSVRMVKKYRKELIDEGYLLIQKGEVDVYFIGQLAVKQFIDGITVEDDEQPTKPLITAKKSLNEK
jgi:hypothetical protein